MTTLEIFGLAAIAVAFWAIAETLGRQHDQRRERRSKRSRDPGRDDRERRP